MRALRAYTISIANQLLREIDNDIPKSKFKTRTFAMLTVRETSPNPNRISLIQICEISQIDAERHSAHSDKSE